jgi:hypothetical protein
MIFFPKEIKLLYSCYTSTRWTVPVAVVWWGFKPLCSHFFWNYSRIFRVYALVRIQWYCVFSAHWRLESLPIFSLRVYGRIRVCECGVCLLCASKAVSDKKKASKLVTHATKLISWHNSQPNRHRGKIHMFGLVIPEESVTRRLAHQEPQVFAKCWKHKIHY